MAPDAEAAPPAYPTFALELELPPPLAERLFRHPALAGARLGRSRGQAEELIWLDTADAALARDGLGLERPRRGPPRGLEILPPALAAWRPGSPPASVDVAVPAAPLVPVAAFTGRRAVLRLAGDVRAELLAGRLRAVADERPVARLLLTGPAEPVLALAGRLAADLPLLPPTAALAEAGRALARGEAPRPRRRGPPLLAGAETVEQAFAAALGHLLEQMLQQAPLCALATGPEGVHQLRVALRRLRSALKAFRPAVRCPAADAFDDRLKALAALLGPARDWDVFLDGVGAEAAAAFAGDRRLAALLRAAAARRAAAYADLRAELDGPGFRRLILDGLGLLAEAPWQAAPDPQATLLADRPAEFGAVLLDRRWNRLCEEGEQIASLDAQALHELRLTAKRLRYAAELFGPLWPGKALRRFLKRLAALQELLGVANDTAVARALVASLAAGGQPSVPQSVPPWAIGAVEGFAQGRMGLARRAALDSWEELMLSRVFWTSP